MLDEKMNAHEGSKAGIGHNSGAHEKLDVKGRYHVICRGADGVERWREDISNLVTTLGKNFLLDSALSGSTYTAAFYLGLVDGASAPTYAAGDTASSHAGWSENASYSNAARPSASFSAATGGSKSSGATTFNISAGSTIAGCFLSTSSVKSGTAGVLISAGSFSAGSRAVLAGDTLAVTYTLSI